MIVIFISQRLLSALGTQATSQDNQKCTVFSFSKQSSLQSCLSVAIFLQSCQYFAQSPVPGRHQAGAYMGTMTRRIFSQFLDFEASQSEANILFIANETTVTWGYVGAQPLARNNHISRECCIECLARAGKQIK